MVLSMPCVQSDVLVDCDDTEFGVEKLSCDIVLGKRPKQENPSLMQAIQQIQRGRKRTGFCVDQLSPDRFVVGLDGGFVLRKGEFESDITVQVAVRYVMHNLTYGPATVPVRCFKLLLRQTC